jgi:hypothetical protein
MDVRGQQLLRDAIIYAIDIVERTRGTPLPRIRHPEVRRVLREALFRQGNELCTAVHPVGRETDMPWSPAPGLVQPQEAIRLRPRFLRDDTSAVYRISSEELTVSTRSRCLTAASEDRSRENIGLPSRCSTVPPQCAAWPRARRGSSVRGGCSHRSRSCQRY